MRRRTACTFASNNLPVHTLGTRGSGTHVNFPALVAQEEGDCILATDELAVGRTVAIVVGADSLLLLIAVGTCGDVAEEEPTRSSGLPVRHADREGGIAVAVDAILSAAAGIHLARVNGLVGVCGCEAEDGGEADHE